MPFGSLLPAFGHPNGGPRRPKRVQKTSKSGFVDTSKTMVLLRKNIVFRGLGAPGSSKSDPGSVLDLKMNLLRYLGMHF